MTESRIPEAESTLRATGSVLGLLPQIAGFTVGFTGLAYITGWRESSAYYGELGAPWAASLLNPSQIMQTSIWLISMISVFAFVSVLALVQKNASQRGLRRVSTFFLLVGGAIYGASLASEGRINASAIHLLLAATSLCWTVGAGTTIGELIACLALQELRWGGYEVLLLYFFVLYGLLQAPVIMGESRGRLAADPMSTRLPSVTLVTPSPGVWRLVAPCGDKLLLISLAPERQGRLFKVVGAENIAQVHASGEKQ